MIKPFFPPIPSVFTEPLGPVASDADLLRAWGGVSPADIRRAPLNPREPDSLTGNYPATRRQALLETHVPAVRARVIKLKEEGRE